MMASFFRKNRLQTTLIFIPGIFLMAVFTLAASRQDIQKKYPVKTRINVETISGNCIVKKGTGDVVSVQLVYDYRPGNNFTPIFDEKSDVLYLKEEIHGSCSGSSTWTLTIPETVKVDFHSSSGNLNVSGIKSSLTAYTASGTIDIADSSGTIALQTASGNIRWENVTGAIKGTSASGSILGNNLSATNNSSFETASGRIEVRDCKGPLTLNSASGNIRCDNVAGITKINNASGSIDAQKITLEGKSQFTTASGNVNITLAKSATYDILVSSASGAATLNFNRNPIQGYFEFQAKLHGGKINAPFPFTKETQTVINGEAYVLKSFTIGRDTPRIQIKTASGRAILKK